jgi:integrase/recombinase XerD
MNRILGESDGIETTSPLPSMLGKLPSSLTSAFAIPPIVLRAGDDAVRRFVEFFTATIRNANTRAAYAHAVGQFLTWCGEQRIELHRITPIVVATYIEQLSRHASIPTVKQHLAAIRMCFDWLVTGHIMPINPAWSVRGPRYSVKRGKTPVLTAAEARQLIDSIDTSSITGLRDRALIGVMVYSFARVSAVVGMDVKDFYAIGKRSWIRLNEKGGKHHEVPAHHNAVEYLDAYITAAAISDSKSSPLFRTVVRVAGEPASSRSSPVNRTGRIAITDNRMSRMDVLRMIKRRSLAAGIDPHRICCHTFRATGITAYLENGGTLEHAQAIAAHESPRTTKLYDRTADAITLNEIERIAI